MLLAVALLLWGALAPGGAGATGFVVTNLNDDGAGSLRQSITDANDTEGADQITFEVTGTIAPLSDLPVIQDTVAIVGNGQIELSGVNPGPTIGLNVQASFSSVSGLAITRFTLAGISVTFAQGVFITGNKIGTDVTGTAALGTGFAGVQIGSAATSNEISANLIANNPKGIFFFGGAADNLVRGNEITKNTFGVDIENSNTMGVTENIISENGVGVILRQSALGNVISSNTITKSVGPGVDVAQNALETRIESNTITSNGGAGVQVGGDPVFEGPGYARILGNAIATNDGLGIDLDPAGVTPNDFGDADDGSNGLQNAPVLTSVVAATGKTTVGGSLNSSPNTQYTVDFFVNDACDASGFGEGETYLGSTDVSTDGSGNASFTTEFALDLPAGAGVTAVTQGTALVETGFPPVEVSVPVTSEFSNCSQPHTCPADCNGDDAINALDFQILGNGVLGIFGFACDPNHDTAMNVLDLQLMVNCFLGTPGTPCAGVCPGL